MQFTAVTEVPTVSKAENKATTELFNGFLESGEKVVQVNLDDSDAKLASVRSSLQNYVKRHKLAIKVYTRGESLYLARTDAE